MRVLVTGGCGYKGSVLVPKLLSLGHEVRVFDTLWFGTNLKPHGQLEIIQGDIRGDVPVWGMDAVIHLAGIANDPCGELDSKLTWEVNVLSTLRLAEACVRAGVRQFIFASSASVYGIKGNEPVREETVLEPVSDYNKTKMAAERVLRSYRDQMTLQIVRPATVCGLSPRMRLDVVVNMLTAQALEKRRITAHVGAHGAALMRPNIHIEDVTDLYCWLLARPHIDGTYNAGFENLSVGETAELIQRAVPCEVELSQVADKRSYRVDSTKLLDTGFRPRHKVEGAISEIAAAWRTGRMVPSPMSVNLAWMRTNGWATGTPAPTADTLTSR